MTFRISLSIIVALAVSACESHPLVGPQGKGRINFANLEVGQSSRYIRFKGEDYFASDDSSFVYFPDTLIVTVVAKDSIWFTIEEKISAGSLARSDSAHADSARVSNYENVYTNRISIANNTLYLERFLVSAQGTFLFWLTSEFSPGPATLTLDRFTEPEIVLHGWKTDPCGCNVQGIVSIYTQLGNEYQNLNGVVNNEPMQYDAGGITFVYSKENGIVHMYGASSWEPSSFGWDLL